MQTSKALRADAERPVDNEVSAAWDADNQQWWDWYVALADNPGTRGSANLTRTAPLPAIAAPSASEIRAELGALYDVSDDDVARFQADDDVRRLAEVRAWSRAW